jgi:hypothetical protein
MMLLRLVSESVSISGRRRLMTTRTRAQAHAPNAQKSRASVKLMKFPQPQSF